MFSTGGSYGGSNAKRINTIQINQSNYGTPIPIVIGRGRISMTLLWFGDFVAKKHKSDGGKGGGGENSVYYTYKAAVLFGICEGTIRKIPRVYVDRGMMADAMTEALSALGFTLAKGVSGQSPWSYLVSSHPTEALGYSGIAWCANPALDLDSGAGIPTFSFDVSGLAELDPTGSPQVYDALPADAVTLILTADRFGAGYPDDALGNFNDWSTYCLAINFLLSLVLREQRSVNDIMEDIAKCTNSEVVWSQGAINFRTYGDEAIVNGGYTFTPNISPEYQLTDDDFIYEEGEDPVKWNRIPNADSYNSFQLEYIDRSKDYNRVVVSSKDQSSIDLYGLRPAGKMTQEYITNGTHAQKIVDLMCQRSVYVRNLYTFKLKQNKLLLEPMDIVGITDANLGLSQFPVRIKSIEEDDDLTLIVTAEEFILGIGTPPSNQIEGAGGYVPNQLVDPGNVAAPVFINVPPALVNGRLELWAAVAGADPTVWGGCQVWVSVDGTTYAFVGNFYEASRYGVLSADLPAENDPDTTNACSVDLSASHGELESGVQSDADAGVTLCWVQGELISYETASLTGANQYDLTYLRRGYNGSVIADHVTGDEFVRLDQSLFVYPYAPAQIGKTIYVKFVSFNVFGKALQDISTITPYSVVLGIAPNDLMSFSVDYSAGNGTAVYTWAQSADLSVLNGGSVEIRFYPGSAGSATWSGATFVGRAAGSATQTTLPYMSGTYLAKAIASSQIECNNPVAVDTTTAPTGGLAAAASPSVLSAMGSNSAVPIRPSISTGNCQCNTTGGTVPYSYLWSKVSGSSSISASASTSPITKFMANPNNNTSVSAVWKCTVTDHVGTVVSSNNVSITITRG